MGLQSGTTATVALENSGNTATLATTTTDLTGTYAFLGLANGTYMDDLEVPVGYTAESQTQVKISLGGCGAIQQNFNVQPLPTPASGYRFFLPFVDK